MATLHAYEKVKLHLKRGLEKGRWPSGGQMPSEYELVAQFGVSRMTVNRALRELSDEGLVDRCQGRGTFAAPLNRVASTLMIRDLHEEIVERGHQHTAKVHLVREEAAKPRLAAQLGLEKGAPVFHTLIVHFENGVPLQCEDRFVNPGFAPDYLQVDFTTTTPTSYLLQVAPLWQARYTIEAALPTTKEASLLRIASTDPCLIVTRRTSARNVPVTVARLVHPGQRHLINGEFNP